MFIAFGGEIQGMVVWKHLPVTKDMKIENGFIEKVTQYNFKSIPNTMLKIKNFTKCHQVHGLPEFITSYQWFSNIFMSRRTQINICICPQTLKT